MLFNPRSFTLPKGLDLHIYSRELQPHKSAAKCTDNITTNEHQQLIQCSTIIGINIEKLQLVYTGFTLLFPV